MCHFGIRVDRATFFLKLHYPADDSPGGAHFHRKSTISFPQKELSMDLLHTVERYNCGPGRRNYLVVVRPRLVNLPSLARFERAARCMFTTYGHCVRSLRAFTACVHCVCSLRVFTAYVHYVRSLREFTTCVHCVRSLRALTA